MGLIRKVVGHITGVPYLIRIIVRAIPDLNLNDSERASHIHIGNDHVPGYRLLDYHQSNLRIFLG